MTKLTDIKKLGGLTILKVDYDKDNDYTILYFTNNSYIKIKAVAADGFKSLGYLIIGGDKSEK